MVRFRVVFRHKAEKEEQKAQKRLVEQLLLGFLAVSVHGVSDSTEIVGFELVVVSRVLE
jgi:hypothetical protein